MKQTAVNWMANELLYLDNEYDMKLIDKNEYQAKRKQIIDQAKAMEKEQKGYSKEEVDNLLNKLLENNMCSHAGDELIEQFKKN